MSFEPGRIYSQLKTALMARATRTKKTPTP